MHLLRSSRACDVADLRLIPPIQHLNALRLNMSSLLQEMVLLTRWGSGEQSAQQIIGGQPDGRRARH